MGFERKGTEKEKRKEGRKRRGKKGGKEKESSGEFACSLILMECFFVKVLVTPKRRCFVWVDGSRCLNDVF